MIELDVTLPLARFALRVAARLGAGVTAVMGPSGAGKSSLIETIAGLRRRARGRIAIGGDVLLDTARNVRLAPEARRVGWVPQDAGLFPHLTVRQNVAFGARADVEAAIDTLGLGPLLDRWPASLSGGERQRVALARALATRPRVLLLDEPLAALDVPLRERVLPYLLRVRAAWRTPIVYVTHNAGEALAVADEVLLLAAGRVVGQGAPFDVVARPALGTTLGPELDNVLEGRVVAHEAAGGVTRVALGGEAPLAVPLAEGLAVGGAVTLAVRAEDVLVATELPHGLSARNTLAGRVTAAQRVGADVLIRCAVAGMPRALVARLTPSAAADLRLEPGRAVWLVMKSHSIRVLGGA